MYHSTLLQIKALKKQHYVHIYIFIPGWLVISSLELDKGIDSLLTTTQFVLPITEEVTDEPNNTAQNTTTCIADVEKLLHRNISVLQEV